VKNQEEWLNDVTVSYLHKPVPLEPRFSTVQSYAVAAFWLTTATPGTQLAARSLRHRSYNAAIKRCKHGGQKLYVVWGPGLWIGAPVTRQGSHRLGCGKNLGNLGPNLPGNEGRNFVGPSSAMFQPTFITDITFPKYKRDRTYFSVK